MNLLQETIRDLNKNGKTENDVIWVGTLEVKTDWNTFSKIANVEYDNGYGSPEVAQDLLIVGKDFWMERHEYDGSEWWEFKNFPVMPDNNIDLQALTIGQARNLDIDAYGWEGLKALNGISA